MNFLWGLFNKFSFISDIIATYRLVINSLEKWAEENSFVINPEKTVQMTFRKGGRTSISDTLTLNQEPLKSTNRFKYLGITLQTRENSFGYHMQEKSAAAIRAIYSLINLSCLSLDTAMTLFNAAIMPIIIYRSGKTSLLVT
mgnify:CR=1 FL=1